MKTLKLRAPTLSFRGVARGGPGGQSPAEIRQISYTLFKPWPCRGADYAPHITACPPRIKQLSTPLSLVCDLRRKNFQKISLFVLFNDLMCKTWCHSIVDISKFDGMKHEKNPSKQCREGHDYNPLVRDVFCVQPDGSCV